VTPAFQYRPGCWPLGGVDVPGVAAGLLGGVALLSGAVGCVPWVAALPPLAPLVELPAPVAGGPGTAAAGAGAVPVPPVSGVVFVPTPVGGLAGLSALCLLQAGSAAASRAPSIRAPAWRRIGMAGPPR
jgi:hypothetical protein